MNEASLVITADDGHVIRAEKDRIDVATFSDHDYVPDLAWRFSDPAGHEFRWDDSKVPGTKTVVTASWWCSSCRDNHEDSHLACAACDAEVAPGYREVPATRWVLGASRYWLDDVEVEQADLVPHLRAAGLHELADQLEATDRDPAVEH